MINNINIYSHLLNANSTQSSTSSAVDEIITEHKQTTTPATDPASVNQANLYLSTRAQKIDLLSQEFFSQGTLDFNDIDALKERVYQLGLISKEDFSRLTGAELSNNNLPTEKEQPSQTLVSFIDDFIKRLDEGEASNMNDNSEEGSDQSSEALTALKEMLVTAKTILADVEAAKTEPNFKLSLTSSLALLKDTINDEFFDNISLDDRVGITKIYQSLDIVDKTLPQRLNNEKLNRYLEIGSA